MRSSILLTAAVDKSGSNWVTVAITAAGVLLGVVFTVLGSLYVANKRITELEVTHAQKLQEVFLSNARAYLESVYLPLHLAQARLAAAYRQYRLRTDPNGGLAATAAQATLAEAIEAYLDIVDSLMDRAAGAFLSPELEDRLEDLNAFLRASLTAQVVSRRVTMSVYVPGFRTSRTVASSANLSSLSFSMLGTGASVEVVQVLQAPLISQDFEERFVTGTAEVRRLIKEVTLGAHASARS